MACCNPPWLRRKKHRIPAVLTFVNNVKLQQAPPAAAASDDTATHRTTPSNYTVEESSPPSKEQRISRPSESVDEIFWLSEYKDLVRQHETNEPTPKNKTERMPVGDIYIPKEEERPAEKVPQALPGGDDNSLPSTPTNSPRRSIFGKPTTTPATAEKSLSPTEPDKSTEPPALLPTEADPVLTILPPSVPDDSDAAVASAERQPSLEPAGSGSEQDYLNMGMEMEVEVDGKVQTVVSAVTLPEPFAASKPADDDRAVPDPVSEVRQDPVKPAPPEESSPEPPVAGETLEVCAKNAAECLVPKSSSAAAAPDDDAVCSSEPVKDASKQGFCDDPIIAAPADDDYAVGEEFRDSISGPVDVPASFEEEAFHAAAEPQEDESTPEETEAAFADCSDAALPAQPSPPATTTSEAMTMTSASLHNTAPRQNGGPKPSIYIQSDVPSSDSSYGWPMWIQIIIVMLMGASLSCSVFCFVTMTRLAEDLDNSQSNLTHYKSQLQTLHNQHNKIHSKLNKTQKLFDEFQRKSQRDLQQAQSQIQQLQSEHNQYKAEIASLQRALTIADDRTGKAEDLVEQLQVQLESSQQELHRALEEKVQLESDVVAVTKRESSLLLEYDSVKKDWTQSVEQIETLEKVKNLLQKELKDANAKVRNLEQDVHRSRQRTLFLEEEIEQWRRFEETEKRRREELQERHAREIDAYKRRIAQQTTTTAQ